MAKRRTNGEGTIRKRTDGRWEARYYNPCDGKMHSLYATNQKAVKSKLDEQLTHVKAYHNIQSNTMTVDEWFTIWFNRYLTNAKPLTVATYESRYQNHIKPYIGDKLLTDSDVDCLQILYNTLYEGANFKKGLSPKTLKDIHGILHKSLEQARVNRYISINPTEGCVLPRVIRREIHPLTDDEIKQFLQKAQNNKYADIFVFTLFTGMRQGEVLGFTWEDIDFDNGTITISRQLQKSRGKVAHYYFGSLKNNKPRTITPANYIFELLKKHKLNQESTKKRMGNKWLGDPLSASLVFTNDIGQHLAHHTVYKNYKAIVSEMNINESRFHDLRHSYAVIALQNGDDAKTVQETLGHHTAAFTLDVYGHVSQKMRRDSANRMENFITSLNT